MLRNHLRPAIRSKRRGRLTTVVILQNDDARIHTARATVATITDLHFDTFSHPPYSPDLAPSDYHMFEPHKEAMGGKKFRSDEEVHQAVHERLRTRQREFFSRGIRALPVRWRKCVECQGDYVEK
jgi:histone-lysine N-methyltransferase SETMAR